MLGDPLLNLSQWLALRFLGGELGTELRLVSVAPREDHQASGDSQCRVPAEILFDQCQSEVDSGGDPRLRWRYCRPGQKSAQQ